LTLDPTTLKGEALLALVQCPPPRSANWHAPLKWWEPREQASPSALQARAACERAWGECYLEGRREPSLDWTTEAELIPEPPKPERGCSALAKASLEAERKAWNKVRRPALGHEVHAILQAWVTQHATPGIEGAWHPPMPWREIDWQSTAGRVAQPATDVLPDPRTLAAVYTELAAECEAPRGWFQAVRRKYEWPKMPGYYDLVTAERVALPLSTGAAVHRLLYRLWDYKSTSSFDWAKTVEELAEDPQILLYALHAMQTFSLQEIECNWVYLLTDVTKQPKSYVVTVRITRADAEAAVLELAEGAAEAIDRIRLFKAGKLRVVDLDQNTSVCKMYGGCVYHETKGGPCAAKVSPGKAMRQAAELEAKIKARKSVRKEHERTHMKSFAEKQAERDAAKKAAEAAGTNTAASTAEVTTVVGTPADKPISTADVEMSVAGNTITPPTQTTITSAPGAITATVDGFPFSVPYTSSLGKQLAKAAKGLQAAAAAFEGE
jgi:hypothetical protein